MGKKTTETTSPLETAGDVATDAAAIADPSSVPLPVEPFVGDAVNADGETIDQGTAGDDPAVVLVRMERDASYGEPTQADVHPDEVENFSIGGWYRAD